MHFPSKTTINVNLFGLHDFDGDLLLFEILIFPMEMLLFWRPHDFLISS